SKCLFFYTKKSGMESPSIPESVYPFYVPPDRRSLFFKIKSANVIFLRIYLSEGLKNAFNAL
ncbi:hypothetical protein, partial [Limosilactobacillus reuteri]